MFTFHSMCLGIDISFTMLNAILGYYSEIGTPQAENLSWLGLYAKTAILLRDTQYFVNRIITVRNPMPIDDVISELDRIGEKLCALQDSYMQVDCSPAQVLSKFNGRDQD